MFWRFQPIELAGNHLEKIQPITILHSEICSQPDLQKAGLLDCSKESKWFNFDCISKAYYSSIFNMRTLVIVYCQHHGMNMS